MRWAQVAGGLALSGLSAVLATTAFPPAGWWPLVFVAFVPMLVAQHLVLPRRWSGLAPGVGIGGFYLGYMWSIFPPGSRVGFPWAPLVIGVAVA